MARRLRLGPMPTISTLDGEKTGGRRKRPSASAPADTFIANAACLQLSGIVALPSEQPDAYGEQRCKACARQDQGGQLEAAGFAMLGGVGMVAGRVPRGCLVAGEGVRLERCDDERGHAIDSRPGKAMRVPMRIPAAPAMQWRRVP